MDRRAWDQVLEFKVLFGGLGADYLTWCLGILDITTRGIRSLFECPTFWETSLLPEATGEFSA